MAFTVVVDIVTDPEIGPEVACIVWQLICLGYPLLIIYSIKLPVVKVEGGAIKLLIVMKSCPAYKVPLPDK